MLDGKAFVKCLWLAMLKIVLTSLARGALIYGSGGVLQRFIGLLLLPFFTRGLTPKDKN